MKKMIKMTASLTLAAVLGFSSCVENEVSEEVKNLRQAQVDNVTAETAKINAEAALVAAETAHENALAASEEARAAAQVIANTQAEASNAIELQAMQAELETYLVEQEVAQSQAANDLVDAQIANAELTEALANVAQEMQNDQVSNYLYMYQMYNDDLYSSWGLYNERLGLEEDLADAVLLLTYADGPGTTWAFQEELILAAKAADEADLAIEEGRLADLEAIEATAELEAAKLDALETIETLQNEITPLKITSAELYKTYQEVVEANEDAVDAAYDDYWDAYYGYYYYGTYTLAELNAAEDDLDDALQPQETAYDNYLDNQAIIADKYDEISFQESLVSIIDNPDETVADLIEDVEDAIETLEEAIAGYEFDLAQQTVDMDKAQLKVDELTSRLAALNEEIAEAEAAAAYWLGLLNDAIAGN